MAKAAKPPILFCFGLGYSARVLAARLLAEDRSAADPPVEGWRVRGTCRSAAKAADLAAAGIEPFLFDRDRPLDDPTAALAGVTHLLSSVPPDEAGDPVLDGHGAALAEHGPSLAWAGYLSTTGVYGDRGGEWVDEDAALAPTGPRGRSRVAAERAWLALAQRSGVPVHVFRLAGIYGPGRNALATVRRGQARRIVKPGQVFSRIHVDDVATVVRASMARANAGRCYNVCDDEAAPPQDVIAHACALLGVAPPPEIPFADAVLSAMARSFYADNKRVRNTRIKDELGVRLAYPNYRLGLAALVSQNDATAADK